jgi:hypothetical protein
LITTTTCTHPFAHKFHTSTHRHSRTHNRHAPTLTTANLLHALTHTIRAKPALLLIGLDRHPVFFFFFSYVFFISVTSVRPLRGPDRCASRFLVSALPYIPRPPCRPRLTNKTGPRRPHSRNPSLPQIPAAATRQTPTRRRHSPPDSTHSRPVLPPRRRVLLFCRNRSFCLPAHNHAATTLGATLPRSLGIRASAHPRQTKQAARPIHQRTIDD